MADTTKTIVPGRVWRRSGQWVTEELPDGSHVHLNTETGERAGPNPLNVFFASNRCHEEDLLPIAG